MIPERIEAAYVDIAVVLHWQPSEMDKMTLDELIDFKKLVAEKT